MGRVFLLLAGMAFLILGCEAKRAEMESGQTVADKSSTETQKRVFREASISRSDDETAFSAAQAPAGGLGPLFAAHQAPNAEPAKGGEKKQPEPAVKPDAPPARKIIYTGNVDLVVPDLDAATQKLEKLVEEHRGFVSHSDVHGTKGERRTATWTIRVPVEEYQAVKEALPKLGEMISIRTDSQDISEEYYDLEARLKNKQVEEKRLLEHLQKSTGKLEEILAVEKELSRVREEIERFQGRLNKLSNLASLTTITVTVQEIKDYVPPSSPTFRTSVNRTFDDSASSLGSFLRNVFLFMVALVPWLPLLAVVIGVPWWLLRRRLRHLPAARNP